MDKFIAYNEKDIKESFDAINYHLSQIDFWTTMFKEQADGKRHNIEFKDINNIIDRTNRIKGLLKDFKIE